MCPYAASAAAPFESTVDAYRMYVTHRSAAAPKRWQDIDAAQRRSALGVFERVVRLVAPRTSRGPGRRQRRCIKSFPTLWTPLRSWLKAEARSNIVKRRYTAVSTTDVVVEASGRVAKDPPRRRNTFLDPNKTNTTASVTPMSHVEMWLQIGSAANAAPSHA